jgi:hypothetical protein
MPKRISPEPGTLVEYATNNSTPVEIKYAKRFQVYLLDRKTYRYEQAYDLSSNAFDATRDWIRRGYTAKVYDAVANKWLSIPR